MSLLSRLINFKQPSGFDAFALCCLSQGSELGSWTLGHWTEDGHDIFQNFPDLNTVYWNAEDKGMVPKLTPNHHVPIPDGYLAENGPVSITLLLTESTRESYAVCLLNDMSSYEKLYFLLPGCCIASSGDTGPYLLDGKPPVCPRSQFARWRAHGHISVRHASPHQRV